MSAQISSRMIFFFNDTATTEIYTLSLHDALPIQVTGIPARYVSSEASSVIQYLSGGPGKPTLDRKSTRLNSSHVRISYAVFCLKKKKKKKIKLEKKKKKKKKINN